MPDPNLERLEKETYLKMIENSIGSKMFNSLYVRNKESGEVIDVINEGEYACAFFVSSLLKIFSWIDNPHATVKTTEQKLIEGGWEKVNVEDIESGDVLVWDEVEFEDKTLNRHIGFAIGSDEAVSTDWEKGEVAKHHMTFGEDDSGQPKREIITAYRRL